jgi:hypothetical protein
MADTNLTLEQVETILVGSPDSPFYMRQNIVVPNVDWGFLNHEADLLVLSKANRLTEIEIKRSWSDFMADFKKKHTHYDKKLSHFYYAVPISIGQKVFDWLYTGEYKCRKGWVRYDRSIITGYTEHNPHKCGLIIYGSAEETGNWRYHLCGINVGARRMNDYKLSTEEAFKLLRLLGMRVWNMKKKLAEYQVEPSLFKAKSK